MKGALVTAGVVLVAIGIVAGYLAATWSPPTYNLDGIRFSAGFPVPPRPAVVRVGTAMLGELAADDGHSDLSVLVENASYTSLPLKEKVAIGMMLAQRLRLRRVAWVGYAPLAAGSSCGRGPTSDRLGRYAGSESSLSDVHAEGWPSNSCLGSLSVRLGAWRIAASAMGAPGTVRAFIHSVVPLGSTPTA